MTGLRLAQRPLGELCARAPQIPAHEVADDVCAVPDAGGRAEVVPLVVGYAQHAVRRVRFLGSAHHDSRVSAAYAIGQNLDTLCICNWGLLCICTTVYSLHMHDGTLSGIKACGHRRYRLTCDSMDELLERSGGRCEICRISGVESTHRMLYIDHDDTHGDWAVRGLLCGTCNTKLEHENRFSSAADRYLKNSWFRRKAEALGVDVDDFPEPTDGTAFRDCHGRCWYRPEGGALWRAGAGAPGRVADKKWSRLLWLYGPINLTRIPAFKASLPDGTGSR